VTSTGRPPLADVIAQHVVLLDGGLATDLERRGHDVSGDLWSAALLRDAPEAIRASHEAYFAAGARVATTASYQASFTGFAAAGIDRDTAAALIRASVTLAAQARTASGLDDEAWVAASVGPYGAVLAAGLRAFHRPRLELLADAGADVLACETIPSLAEVEALLAELESLAVPAWLSLTTVTTPDGRVLTRRGEDAGEAFAMAAGASSVIAVGVNCTAPEGVSAAVRVAARRSGKLVVVYPNSGETWDGPRRTWIGRPGLDAVDADTWVGDGTRLVGGCCRIGPDDIAALARALGHGTDVA
jgi:homocysteine S-methyltransferase